MRHNPTSGSWRLAVALLMVALVGVACSSAGRDPTTAGEPVTPTSRAATPNTAKAPTAKAPLVHPASAACPRNLANSLASTGAARQVITVEAASYDTSVAVVEAWQYSGACWEPAGGPWPSLIGEHGLSDHHREGDGTTPTGIYRIGPTMYGNAPNPGVQEPYHHLVCGDWWDEDPTTAAYNTFEHVPCGQSPPFGGASEPLWSETVVYPSLAVVEYNTDPVVPYAGSAIFVHAENGHSTVGCISLPLADLDRLLRWISPADSTSIVMGPASEMTRF